MNSTVGLLSSDALCQLSRLIISSLPAENSKVAIQKAAITAEQCGFKSSVELNNNIEMLFGYWQKALYHSTKPATVRSDFEKVGVNSDIAQKLTSIWLEEGAKVMPKAKSLSRSGKPVVKDIRWTLNLQRATKSEPIKRVPYINLQFNTDQKKKYVSLNFDELKQLHVELQKAQNSIDSIYN
ncbi:hypothetical protein M3Y98_00172400 [Aphelenchoides besseyi]|nr:hypothetical protein M3Y98_00172400 [Aphelenchoides besseyi]KAI6200019.1 hypothetical protein M3Y96_00689100 [Aphelenchoides besseyi]